MKTTRNRLAAFCFASLGLWIVVPGCEKEETKVVATAPTPTPATAPTAEELAAKEKAAVDKALADKASADKAAADAAAVQATKEKDAAAKALTDKAAADKAALDATASQAARDKAMVDKALADKAAADKAVADAAAKQAAADKLAEQEKAEASAMPTDLLLMKSEMNQGSAQIDMTIAKLEVLAVSSGNLKQPSKDAVAAIDALNSSAQSLAKRASDMRDRGAAYFEAWDKQLAATSTPEVAAMMAKRKDELAADYAQVLTAMQETRAAFDPFWADVKSIRDTVDKGVKPESQPALSAQVAAAKEKSTSVKTRLEALSSKLNDVSVIYKGK